MNCKQVRSYLSMYLDSELGSDTTFEISQHLESCNSCRSRAEKEEFLESLIRKELNEPQQGDDLIWNYALQNAVSGKSAFLNKRALFITSLVLAAAVFALFYLFPFGTSELDLAAAAESAHAACLDQSEQLFSVTGDNETVNSYFRKYLSTQFTLKKPLVSGIKFVGGSICELHGVRSAHLMFMLNNEFVSVFWLDKANLPRFPDIQKRMKTEGKAFHCRVNQQEFFVRLTDDALVCAVGSMNSTDLQTTLDGMYGPFRLDIESNTYIQ